LSRERLTPRSFRLDDAQRTLVGEVACSKHRRRDTLPVHRVLVSMAREWVRDLGPDELLFPRIERKKTWLMVEKDLERIGIPYETPGGITDFDARTSSGSRGRRASGRWAGRSRGREVGMLGMPGD
jgi:hypothetical protein